MEKREIIKRYLYHFLLFFLFGITVIISGTEHSYADAQVIRVGFTQDGQMIRQTDDAYTGYGVEYLDMIADYTGWQYEYVMIPEEDRLKALEDGVIDLLCDVSKMRPVQGICCLVQKDRVCIMDCSVQRKMIHLYFLMTMKR